MSVVLTVFDCILLEVRGYELISINAVTVSYLRSTWIRYQKTIPWSVTKYSKKLSGQCNVTAEIEGRIKKNIDGTAKKYFRLLKQLVFQSCDYPHCICISFRQFDWYIYIIFWAIFTFNIHLLVSAIYYIYFADESYQCNSRWRIFSRNVR